MSKKTPNKTATRYKRTSQPLGADLVKRLRALVDEIGVVSASEKLSVSRSTLASALAGLPLRIGSVALLERGLS